MTTYTNKLNNNKTSSNVFWGQYLWKTTSQLKSYSSKLIVVIAGSNTQVQMQGALQLDFMELHIHILN